MELLLIISSFLSDAINELEMKLKQLQIANQKLARNSRGSSLVLEKETVSYSNDGQRATVEDVTTLTKIQQQQTSNGSSIVAAVSVVFLALWIHRVLRVY